MKKTLFCCLIGLLFSFYCRGQRNEEDLITNRMSTQFNIFPQEKLYLHTDRTFYVPGEKIWFKAYLVDAAIHIPMLNSRYVYVELINPLDSVVNRVMIRPHDDLFHGHISLEDDLPEGDYTLRAYTRYMEKNQPNDFFHKRIHIGSLLASQIKPYHTISYDNAKNKVVVDLYYTAGFKDEKIKPDNLMMRNGRGGMQKIRMDKDTIAHINLSLPLKEDVLHIVADNYQHYIPIPGQENDYDVAFFPEGGYVVENQLIRIAFKAINTNGLSEDITGILYCDDEPVNQFRSEHGGMGLIPVIWERGKKYRVECINDLNIKKTFYLPDENISKYAVKTQFNKENMLVTVVTSEDRKTLSELNLLLYSNNSICYFNSWPKDKQHLVFPFKELPSGMIHVMLLDKDLNPISERLMFIPLKEHSLLNVKTANEHYATREKISLDLTVLSPDRTPLKGDFSIAVTDDKDVTVDSVYTIETNLLLTSELKGYIENPGVYFDKDNPKSPFRLDLLMMTQGWRRYDIPEVLKGNYSYPEHPAEQMLEIEGHVRSLVLSKPVKDGEVSLMLKSRTNDFFIDQTKTNADGMFYFGNMEFPDSTEVFLQSLNRKGKDAVELVMKDITYPPTDKFRYFPKRIRKETKAFELIDEELFMDKMNERAKYDEDIRIIHLKEVNVTASRLDKKELPKSHYAGIHTVVVDIEEKMKTRHYNRLLDIFYEIPGVQVQGSQLIIRGISTINGSSEAMVMVDGMPMDTSDEILMYFNVHDVATVEVYKGADASIFGMRGGNGVVNIITKKGGPGSAPVSYNKSSFSAFGYQRPVEFYTPKYETPVEKSSAIPDLRTTIYWKPDIIPDENGKAKIEFYSADTPTSYSIIVEGITSEGIPVREVKKIDIR